MGLALSGPDCWAPPGREDRLGGGGGLPSRRGDGGEEKSGGRGRERM